MAQGKFRRMDSLEYRRELDGRELHVRAAAALKQHLTLSRDYRGHHPQWIRARQCEWWAWEPCTAGEVSSILGTAIRGGGAWYWRMAQAWHFARRIWRCPQVSAEESAAARVFACMACKRVRSSTARQGQPWSGILPMVVDGRFAWTVGSEKSSGRRTSTCYPGRAQRW